MTSEEKIKVIVITGPTATGKTALAVKLALKLGGEIISVDSRQVYRGLDLGTGKDLEEYSDSGKEKIKYHLIDIVGPEEEYNLMRFLVDAEKVLREIRQRKKLPFLVGGTALYLNALLSGYRMPGGPPRKELRDSLQDKSLTELNEILKNISEECYDKINNKNSRSRLVRAIEMASENENLLSKPFPLKLHPLIIGIYLPREKVHQRIADRLEKRFKQGMVEEVASLHEKGLSWQKLEYFGLEYRYIAQYLQNKITFNEMKDILLARIRRLAKSQDVWFRKMEKQGFDIYWIEKGNFLHAMQLIEDFLDGKKLPEVTFQLKNIHYGPISS